MSEHRKQGAPGVIRLGTCGAVVSMVEPLWSLTGLRRPTGKQRLLAAIGVGSLLAISAALGYEQQGYELREEYRRQSEAHSRALLEAMEATGELKNRAVNAPRAAGTGDTLYMRIPGPSQKVEEVALYVDKSIGGLRLRDGQGDVRLLATGIASMRVDRVDGVPGKGALLVELTSVSRGGTGLDLRRRICRYMADREQYTG